MIRIPVVAPPRPCPCVIEASSQSQVEKITVPIAIIGVGTAPIELAQVPRSTLRLVDADLGGWGPLRAWFGASPQRTLTLQLRNTGTEPLDVPPFTLVRGRGREPNTVVRSVDLGVIEAGQTRSFRIPVRFDPLAFGKFTVRGSIAQGADVTFRASTRAYPWGLIVLGALLAQLVLLWVRDRGRDRLLRDEPLPTVPGLDVLLADEVDPLDYWGWWLDEPPRALPAAPLLPWCVDSDGVVSRTDGLVLERPPAPPVVEVEPAAGVEDVVVLDRSRDDPLTPVEAPEVAADFRARGPRHGRRHARDRRARRSPERGS